MIYTKQAPRLLNSLKCAVNCILSHLLFKQAKEWSLNYKDIVPLTAVDCAAGHWDGNLVTMAYFFVLSDCGKISLLYSDIFPFFSYNEERDWWRKQQKKNNYRQREGTTQNSIMLFRRVNHFRKGSEDKPFYFNSSLRWYFPPPKQEGTVTLDMVWHAELLLNVPTQQGAQKLKNCSFNLAGFRPKSCLFF